MLEIAHVKKHFAQQKAVDDISFSIERGSIFGLLGPNGAGKTTLIRMITGIFRPDSGHILFDGHPFDPEKDPQYIGYMPEERGLYKKMKIGEQAIYLAQLKGLSKKEALEQAKQWFIKFDMQSWWNKKVEDLSKGMSQKLQFVTTVLHQPKLIILDEPFSGLDPVNANLIKDEIFNLAQKGATIIFSTHRMEQVEEICNHIILVNQGKKVLDGMVSNIQQQFKENNFSVLHDAASFPLNDALYQLVQQSEQKAIIQIRAGCHANQVLEYLLEQHIPIRGFQEVLPGLNEVFIKCVEHTGGTRAFSSIS